MGAIPGSREPSPTVSAASGFDPERMSDPWRAMVAEACEDAKRQEQDGIWRISGERADFMGTRAMQLVADTVRLIVVPTGPSDHHTGSKFVPCDVEAKGDVVLDEG